MTKHLFLHGIIAGILASAAGVVYLKIYEGATLIDFSPIISVGAIIGACMVACLLMALGYWGLARIKKTQFTGILNIVIMLFSFLSILGPIGMTLPLEFDFPEMLPGLAVPMHFFPAMIFFGIQPFFGKGRSFFITQTT